MYPSTSEDSTQNVSIYIHAPRDPATARKLNIAGEQHGAADSRTFASAAIRMDRTIEANAT